MTKIPISDPKVEFEMQLEYLSETSKSFINHTAKVAGFLLLAIGWLATSGDARSFLAIAPVISCIAALSVILACSLSILASWTVYSACEKTYRNLVDLAYLPEHAYAARKLQLSTFLICIFGIFILGILLAAALLLIPDVSGASTTTSS